MSARSALKMEPGESPYSTKLIRSFHQVSTSKNCHLRLTNVLDGLPNSEMSDG